MSVIERLDKAFAYLSHIPVSGDAVDYMAMARQELRNAYKELSKTSKEEAGESDGG